MADTLDFDLDHPIEAVMEFLDSVNGFRERYQDFEEEMNNQGSLEKKLTTLDVRGREPSLLAFLYRARGGYHYMNQMQEQGQVVIPADTADAMHLGMAIQMLEGEGVPIVDPSGDGLDQGIEDIYAQRMVDEENFWDTFYELERAAWLANAQFDIQLVHERGGQSGPDIVLKSEDDVWIECKNKRDRTPSEWDRERAGRLIGDRLWQEHNLEEDIGDSSFAVTISSNVDPGEAFVDELSEEVARVVREQEEFSTIKVDGHPFEIRLEDYKPGSRTIELSDDEMEQLRASGDLRILEPFSHLDYGIDPFHGQGHGVPNARYLGENEFEILNAHIIEFDVPWDIEYHEWIRNTVNGVRSQFPNHSPIVVYIYVPMGIIYTMKNEWVVNHEDDLVTKWQRLGERIIGVFNETDRISAVVITTRAMVQKGEAVETARPIQPIFHRYPDTNLPTDFSAHLVNSMQIDAVASQPMQGALRRQHPY
ncbi:hypothetical protein EXE53_24320 [Halorubrum sp. SD626R]|uniref:hypothetical protein n=1 Tax=Halorubrum sp. SD626R TaxID=1419722 RepID=UPI0010F99AB4|nr:hypothetical protein [Halorubrum sp. SD626R]TKX77860.1 hypothetical protein EXE53_24320 [Halorubrum sp. SD626R]